MTHGPDLTVNELPGGCHEDGRQASIAVTDDDLNAIVKACSDSTAVLVDGMLNDTYSPYRIPADMKRLLSIKQQMDELFESSSLQKLSREEKYRLAGELEGVGQHGAIIQGQLFELLWLEYLGDRKRFLKDCYERTRLKEQAIDDRRRVYRKLNASILNAQLTWRTVRDYVLSISFTLWRELSRDRWNGRWTWRDGKVFLVDCPGEGKELSTFLGHMEDKPEALLATALRNKNATDPKKNDNDSDSDSARPAYEHLNQELKMETTAGMWSIDDDADTPTIRKVSGINVKPESDAPDTAFIQASKYYSFYVDEQQARDGQQVYGRTLHFFDYQTNTWLEFPLSGINA